MTARTGLLCLLLLLASCAVGYRIAPAGEPLQVGNSNLVVTAPNAWNRAGTLTGPGKNAELWTLDGPRLNEITFYGGIADGETLFRETDRRERPLPRFRAAMLPPEIAALFESSYRVASGTALFVMGAMAPADFAGQQGFRFDYDYTLRGEEIRREGRATGAVIDGRLYMITFEAPEIHYFENGLADYEAIVTSARIAPDS
ncbi:MAG: hypothetical protein RLN87_01840 [Parasphingopyxis sp.]|uniref:hypothetical protein n=2 Tax=Parasphingopyxis TaxID=1234545 RepID=UPI0032EA9247